MVPPVYVFLFIFIFSDSELVLRLSSAAGDEAENCPPSFECGNLGNLTYPYTTTQRKSCGIFPIHGCDDHNPNATKTVQLINGRKQFQVRGVDKWHFSILVKDEDLEKHLPNSSCEVFGDDIDLPHSSALGYYQVENNITLYKCNRPLTGFPSNQFLNYTGCVKKSGETIYYGTQNIPDNSSSLASCSTVQLPVKSHVLSSNPFTFIAAEFSIYFQVSDDCNQCYFGKHGKCGLDRNGKIVCINSEDHRTPTFPTAAPTAAPREHKRTALIAVIIGLSIGSTGIIIIVIIILLLNRRRHKSEGFQIQPRNIHSDNYTNTNTESGIIYFGVPVFSYEELEQSTNSFDPSGELGKGGFGVVYYGKLKDGREVAVKRLFERSFRCVEQFKNEIQILTRLRHKNLVSLYGCTSRHSRELLLVYEYIPNGTVGCHLHGKLASPGSLPWPVRMRIAVETASALSYLHACDIIHRDVKTSNLLLDNNFCVKVADFGLSRLFPNFLSHVSTAPQGTPGYLDPEYHHCYQLTNKSDVYSFGVVLIELISSLPAIDITRDKDEIKLANLALKLIQRREFTQLVDSSLGFESDNEVRRMMVSVAKLAFRCLQRDKDMRPSMDEVMELLQKIESGEDDSEDLEFHGGGISEIKIHTSLPTSLGRDEAGSLMNLKPQPFPQTL